VYFAVKKTEQ